MHAIGCGLVPGSACESVSEILNVRPVRSHILQVSLVSLSGSIHRDTGAQMRRDEGAVSGDVTHDTDEIIGLDRRRFLNMLGMAVLTVRCIHANAFDTVVWLQGTAAADDLIVHSGPGALSHRHDLVIPMSVI